VTLSAGPDAASRDRGDSWHMRATGYAAVWQDGGPVMAGRILLEPRALKFEGAGTGRQASRRIAYAAIADSHLSRRPVDRVGGLPALVLELRDGETIRVATTELGTLHELIEDLKWRGRAAS
jgi:hypothetical protein